MKISLLEVYIVVNKFNVICLSKTYPYLTTAPDENNLDIPGCKLIRFHHRFNHVGGGVFIYYKDFLPLKILNIQIL